MNKKKGISLIILVITIIVILILAGSVILSLSQNNPIISATEANFKSDINEVSSSLSMYALNQATLTSGNFDINTMDGKISTFIPSITKYDSTFDVVNGKLIYIGTDNQTIAFARNMNLDITSKYDGTAVQTKTTSGVISQSAGTVEAWVNVTNTMRSEVTEKYIFSTYADEKYTNTLALRHTRDNKWQAIISSDLNNISDISVTDSLNEGWHLFSLKWSLTEFSMFIDGVKVATTTSPNLVASISTNWYIGGGPRLNLVRNGYLNSGNNSNFTSLTYFTSDYYTSPSSFIATGNYSLETTDFIAVDPNKMYTQSGVLKSVGTGGNSFTYYGIATYDKDKLYIDSTMSNHYLNSETTLARDLNPGDTIVYLSSVANWKTSSDGSSNRNIGIYPYKDYPVYTYTRNYYGYASSDLVNNTITLNSAYTGLKISAGTKVANNNNSYGSLTYSTICAVNIPNTWTSYSSNISTNKVNQSNWQQFRYGTAYIRPLFLLNYAQNTTYATLVDDIEFKDTNTSTYDSKIQEICVSNVARSDSDILARYKTGILTKDSNVTFVLSEQ